jgi:Transcriptional activator TraM
MKAVQPQLPLKVMPGKRPDARALAAKVFERHGITLREDDPAFALVTLNELILRNLIAELWQEMDQHVRARLAEFDQAIERAEWRAGKTLAQQVRESAGRLQESLREEIAAARPSSQQAVEKIRNAYRRASLIRWCVVSAVAALVVFACGFWAGRF